MEETQVLEVEVGVEKLWQSKLGSQNGKTVLDKIKKLVWLQEGTSIEQEETEGLNSTKDSVAIILGGISKLLACVFQMFWQQEI